MVKLESKNTLKIEKKREMHSHFSDGNGECLLEFAFSQGTAGTRVVMSSGWSGTRIHIPLKMTQEILQKKSWKFS